MKKLVLTAAIAAIVGVPAVASAQATFPPIPAGAVVCRTPIAGDTANATFGTTQLFCRKVNVARVMAAEEKLMSMMPKHMTPEQMKSMNAASASMNNELMLPVIPGTNGAANQ